MDLTRPTPTSTPTLSPADRAAHVAASYVRPASGIVAALADVLLIEASQPVTRMGLQRAIQDAAYARHGVTPFAERARAADAYTATVRTARVPYAGLTQGQYARLLTAGAAA
ncbi:hypothetical protein [Streptomyces sp. NPDC087525]|uniref:hypothetical protein n=1 Tax=Streptomyces sp. NPDC087525 TaxID=3365793 RepID=UPI00381E42BA